MQPAATEVQPDDTHPAEENENRNQRVNKTSESVNFLDSGNSDRLRNI